MADARADLGSYIGGVTAEPRPPLLRRLLRTRLRVRHWRLLDRVFAAGFAVVLGAYAVVRDGPLAVAGVLVVAVALDQRRVRPLIALVALIVVAPLSVPLWVAVATWASALYCVASTCAVRASLAGLALALAPAAVMLLWVPRLDAQQIAAVALSAMVPGVAWTLGYTVRQHRAYTEALHQYRLQRTAADTERAQRAIGEERLRIARELHDVVAHTMGVVTVQAAFGTLVIDDRPDLARTALAAVEAAGREALTELRRLLGVLRDEATPDATERRPAPGLDTLERLLAQTAQAGVQVGLRITGNARPLPPGLDLTAYRIVQESLTNMVRHADVAEGSVVIDYRADELAIEVTDAGRGGPMAPGGHGLAGMRERVALYGGRLSATPRPDGGFRVSARLPLPPEPLDVTT